MRFRPPDPPGSFRAAGLHLAGLSALAVAQPLFDLLSHNVEFFAVRGSSRWDVVLFAVGLVVLPPLLLLGVEALAGLARAATGLHLVFVAGLVALLVLQALRGLDAPAVALLAASAALGAGAAVLYARARPARTLLTVLGAAPLLFLVLFLFFSPTSRLLASPPDPELARTPSGAPVVMVVLDELPVVSLMRGDGEIDADRYPNFARFARDATWYRNATTVHEWTTGAVPAILTGREPEGLPLFIDHPDNLFTLLGGSYDMDVFESQTHLCPPELCDPDRDPLPKRVASLLSDLAVVYGHIALPDDLADELPSISTAWGDFDGGDPHALLQQGPDQPGQRPAAYTERDAEVQAFVDSLGPSERPTLSLLHVLLPHHPWEYLPDGKRYASDLGFQPGLVNEGWTGDPELAIQAQQRHLLQVGYTDLALGRVLDRLEETGLYDKSLVIVVADHGVSFRPHGERRRVEEGNMEEIAFVPLFVKPPGQTEGEVVDEHARTIDIVPTIADVLGIEVPWETDGRSLLAGGAGPEVRVQTSSGEVVVGDDAELLERREQVLARQVELFGEGDEQPGLFGIGPRPDLLGKAVDGPAAAASGGPTFESYGTSDFDPASAVAPVRVYGRIDGAPAGEEIAIAVNGRIVAVTRSFAHDGTTLVSAVTPEDAYRPGTNAVRLYVVQGSGAETVLRELPPSS